MPGLSTSREPVKELDPLRIPALCPVNASPRVRAAWELAVELESMAQSVWEAGHGTEAARRWVYDSIDGYWHRLVLGRVADLALILEGEPGDAPDDGL